MRELRTTDMARPRRRWWRGDGAREWRAARRGPGRGREGRSACTCASEAVARRRDAGEGEGWWRPGGGRRWGVAMDAREVFDRFASVRCVG